VYVGLVLHSDTAEVSQDILHLGIRMTALGAAKLIDPFDLEEEEVDDGNDDGNANRVSPNNNDGDDAGLAVGLLGVVVARIREKFVGLTDQPAEYRRALTGCPQGRWPQPASTKAKSPLRG